MVESDLLQDRGYTFDLTGTLPRLAIPSTLPDEARVANHVGSKYGCEAALLPERIADEPHTRLRFQCSAYYTSTALYPFISQLEQADSKPLWFHQKGLSEPPFKNLYARRLLGMSASGY